MFDVYIRVSRLGERTEDEATEVYEAQCLEWASRHDGIVVDEVIEDTDVSGAVAVARRKLERLIQKVESGESEGIITPYLDRFGRDLIEGALAYKRIREADGRLVCVRDGVDSDRPGDELQFNIRLAFAQDYLSRTRSNFQAARDRKVEHGAHVHQVKPGYRRDDDGRLVRHEAEAKRIEELFERRATGETVASLARWLPTVGIVNRYGARGTRPANSPYTPNGVRTLISSRTYLGDVSVPSSRKGHPRVITNAHPPIVTAAQWEAANAIVGAFSPRNQTLALQARLRGLVWCAGCGRRMKVSGYGKPGAKKASYTCTQPDCEGRASIRAMKLDDHVEQLLREACRAREPHVWSVIEGSSAFTDALEAVEAAQAAHDELRDDIDAQRQLGIKDWTAALKVRRDAITLARQALSKVRRTKAPSIEEGDLLDFLVSDAIPATQRGLAELVAKVEVQPSPNGATGAKVPAGERVKVTLVGAAQPHVTRPD